MTEDPQRLAGELLALAETLERRGSAVGSGIVRRAASALTTGPPASSARCQGCDAELDTSDPRRRHCSPACRQRAHRRRHAVTHP